MERYDGKGLAYLEAQVTVRAQFLIDHWDGGDISEARPDCLAWFSLHGFPPWSLWYEDEAQRRDGLE
jgi:hypothetical protein